MPRIMYEVIKPGMRGFESEVWLFTDALEMAQHVAVKMNAELWRITYEGESWKRWKEEKIEATTQLKLI